MKLNFSELERLRNETSPGAHKFPLPHFADVHNGKIKLVQKLAMPQGYYGLNFGGNIIGKGGENIQKLKEQTNCKIMVFGKGSITDKQKVRDSAESVDFHRQQLKFVICLGTSLPQQWRSKVLSSLSTYPR